MDALPDSTNAEVAHPSHFQCFHWELLIKGKPAFSKCWTDGASVNDSQEHTSGQRNFSNMSFLNDISNN